MTEKGCSSAELKARIVALESGLSAFKDLMEERDKRYGQRSDAQDAATLIAMTTSKEAVTKAESATEKRLETLNELRGVVVDQSQNFARASEMKLINDALEGKMQSLSETVRVYSTMQQGHSSGVKDMMNYVVTFASLLIAAVAIYFRPH